MMECIVDIPYNIQRRKMKYEEAFSIKTLTGWPVREEIIRCRDCKYHATDGITSLCNHFCVGYWDMEREEDTVTRCVVDPDDFCAWAERDE